jgi:hypothetical protein
LRVSAGKPLHAALSSTELAEVSETTIALFELDEGSGDTAQDKSRSNWQANIVGASWIE